MGEYPSRGCLRDLVAPADCPQVGMALAPCMSPVRLGSGPLSVRLAAAALEQLASASLRAGPIHYAFTWPQGVFPAELPCQLQCTLAGACRLQAVVDLFLACTSTDPSQRPSAKELVQRLAAAAK